MENQVSVVREQNVAVVTEQTITEYLKGQGVQLPQRYMVQFINIAKAYGLDPFKREIYAVGYGDNYNIITGYEVYLKRADRTGKLDGWSVQFDGGYRFNNGRLDVTSDMSCTITIYRKDWKYPLTHTVFINECIGKKKDGSVNSMWLKMPSFMLKKVAISQGFRLAFPDELGGLPYTESELPEVERPVNEYHETPKAENKVAPKAPVAPVEQKKEEPSENAIELENFMREYSSAIQPNVMTMCETALNSNKESEVVDKLNRLKVYLHKKGVLAA